MFIIFYIPGPVYNSKVMNVDVIVTAIHFGSRISLPFLQAAATECVSKALKEADGFLMEPVMTLNVRLIFKLENNTNMLCNMQ